MRFVCTQAIVLALTGADHTTVARTVAPSRAGGASTPQIHYLGTRQELPE